MKEIQGILFDINDKYSLRLKEVKKDFIACSKKFNLIFFKKTMDKYRILLKNIIVDIASYFDELKNADFIIFKGIAKLGGKNREL